MTQKLLTLGYEYSTANEAYTLLCCIWWWVSGECRGVSESGAVGAIRVLPNKKCKLLATVPYALSQNVPVIVLADTEFGTIEFLAAVRKRSWRAVVGMRCTRKMQDGRSLKQLYRNGKRGQQICLAGISEPLTVSWFWLKRAEGKRELRFIVSTHPYSGVYLVRLGRKRWTIESFFKTIKHRFGLHRFGQSTQIGVYRWLILSFIAYLLAHWIDQWSLPPLLD